MSSRSRSAPFSTHARGVPLFDKGRFFDVSRHATSALLDLRDIGSSIFWYISMQSWLTFWSLIVNIISGKRERLQKRLLTFPSLSRPAFYFFAFFSTEEYFKSSLTRCTFSIT